MFIDFSRNNYIFPYIFSIIILIPSLILGYLMLQG